MFNVFLRLFKVLAGISAVAKTTKHCRNWNGVDTNILEKLYSWLSEKSHFIDDIDDMKCPLECLDYQYKTQKYFNASLIVPYPIASEHFSELCTMPCITNTACQDLEQN